MQTFELQLEEDKQSEDALLCIDGFQKNAKDNLFKGNRTICFMYPRRACSLT